MSRPSAAALLQPSSPKETAPADAGALHQPIGSLVTGDAEVPPSALVRDVAERFFRTPDLEAVAITDGGRPVGLLTRPRLLLVLARGFGYELHARKPVSRIADGSPLVLPEQMDVAEAVQRALQRPADAVYDEIIVAGGEGRYRGLLSVRQLVLHQGFALARSLVERESAVARARGLEELERERARFLSHATHELRSPVNAIVGLAELLRMACERQAWGQVQERLPMLMRAAAGLRGTVNNILDLSKMEAGRMQALARRVELLPLLEDMGATARILLGSKPVTVAVYADPGAEALETDEQKLRQILTNLVSNAVKFTDRGRIVIGAEPEGAGVRLWVEDTGMGIREEDLDRLFVPFGQLEDALTKEHAGSGLGLVITRSLAVLLGGLVAVESRYGEGSKFSVHLPASPGARGGKA